MRHTFSAAGTTFTVDARYQALSSFGRHHLGSELTVAVWDKNTGKNRVIRKFCNVSWQFAEAKRCLREIRFLRHFKGHDNIALLYDLEVNFHSNGDFDEVYLIEEYCETDLRKIVGFTHCLFHAYYPSNIRLECPLSGVKLQAFAHQILRGVNYIHSAGVVLQDLSPHNIIINEAGAVKIAGFGNSHPSIASNGDASHLLNPYQAPEVTLRYDRLSAAANVWSVGCIIAELATGWPIFSATTLRNHIYEIFELTGLPSESTLSAIADSELRDYVLSIGSITRIPLAERVRNVDSRLLDLLSEVFFLHVDSRITCKDALSHKYLDAVQCRADGFICFPYKGNLDEDISDISQVKSQLVEELRSFYVLQHDGTMDISLPELDFGTDVVIPSPPISPLEDVASRTHSGCASLDMSALWNGSLSTSSPTPLEDVASTISMDYLGSSPWALSASNPLLGVEVASSVHINHVSLGFSGRRGRELVVGSAPHPHPRPPLPDVLVECGSAHYTSLDMRVMIDPAGPLLTNTPPPEAETSEKGRNAKFPWWSHLKNKLSELNNYDLRTPFRNGFRRWSCLRGDIPKDVPATRDLSLGRSNPPTLHLGMDDIEDDIGQTVKSSLAGGRSSQSVDDLTRQIRKTSAYPYTGGAFGDIWKCYRFRDSEDDGPELVAVKAMRTTIMNDKIKEKKRFHRELGVWKRLDHKNIMPLYGITYGFGSYPAMVCPWAPNGTLSQYLQLHHSTLSMAEKFQILDDVASGLKYLHSNHVTHGDLTGNNILLFGDGRAVLADFGMSTALKELWGSAYFTESARGTLRWAAPELFQCDEEGGVTGFPGPPCDVYSFGSIILQVLSGKVPYFHLTSNVHVIGMVVRGIRPERPRKPGINDEQWGIIQWCWKRDATQRPEIGEVADALNSLRLRELAAVDDDPDIVNEDSHQYGHLP